MSDGTPPNPAGEVTVKPASLRTRMLIDFGLIFIVGILIVDLTGLYGIPYTDYRGEYGQRRTEAFQDLAVFADNRKAGLLQLIAQSRGDAVTFCESPVLRKIVARLSSQLPSGGTGKGIPSLPTSLLHSDDRRSLTNHLSVIKKTHADLYERIEVADAATGSVIASTDRGAVGINAGMLTDFPEMRAGVEDEGISEVRDPRSGTTNLAIAHVVKGKGAGEEGEDVVTAVLILYLKTDVFFKTLEAGANLAGKSGETYLIDDDGKLLTSLKRPLPDGTLPRPLETRVATRAATLAIEGNEGVIVTSDYAGVPVLAAFRHLRLNSETALGMVVTVDQSEVFAPIHQLVVFVVLKALILCLLALGFTYVIATRLARPIKKLSLAARRVEGGNFDARAPVERDDEVGALAVTFNAMVERIQHWQSELEEEVRGRTAQLVAVNAELNNEITERKHAEEALRASERRFRELLETVHMVAVILDREGKIVFCNDFLLVLTGWSRDELLGRSWFDIFVPEEVRSIVKALFTESMAAGTMPIHYENPIVTRSGNRRIIVWDNTLLRDSDGGVVGSASLGIDVSEHRSMEEQLRHAQKMEAIGQLAGGVAHDFNNLLMAIIGNCELIKRKIPPGNTISGHIDRIIQVSNKAARLTQSLLAFSRKQLLKIEAVNINDCARDVGSLLERVIGEDIELQLRQSEEELPVLADRDLIEQVLLNLAMNARDAMPKGGILLIETSRADFDEFSATLHGLDQAGAYAVIHVSDTGSGMDEAVREKIFDPFFTTKEVGKGTGLGLAMAFGTINQHGGRISVDSEVGKGTLFEIYLPLILEGVAANGHAAEEDDALGGNETLLVVEDDDDVRELTITILQQSGYRVIGAADGEEAIARFREALHSVSLVILDVVMPRMNGKELYDALRTIRPDIRALFISGYSEEIINERVMLEEHLYLLQKPVAPKKLLRKIREILDLAGDTG